MQAILTNCSKPPISSASSLNFTYDEANSKLMEVFSSSCIKLQQHSKIHMLHQAIGTPKIGLKSFIFMIEHILVSIIFNLTRATLLSLRNHINS